jgi:uncharacterized protein YdhG (YjbR/CyaY superfamily)
MKIARKKAPRNVDDYIAGFPPSVQPVLERVRNTIRRAVSGADETISYGIPAFKMRGRYVIYFAGWKEHYSIYPSTDRVLATFKDDLAAYELSGKGTIRFPLSSRVPARLIAGIARVRAEEVAERERTRKVAPKKSSARRR